MTLTLDGHSLTIKTTVQFAREGGEARLSDSARESVSCSREFIEDIAKSGDAVYGITTGFGKFQDTYISKKDIRALQRNLIVSHACGMGEPLPREAVRAVMLLRANALAAGNSGIRPSTIDALLDMLNRDVTPVVPEKGSLGASGDLAPLAHIALVLIGEGEAYFKDERLSGAEAMRRAGIEPVELVEKEGLALINGTQVMAALGCFAVYDALKLIETANAAAATTCEALMGITTAFDKRVHALRPHAGQAECAAAIARGLRGGGLARTAQDGRVQDAYSLRCAPQVHGACLDAVRYAESVLSVEINSVTDNPLVFPDDGDAISGGNFHGEPLALALDFLAIAVSEIANISERRLERLVNPALSNGLPAFLISDGGVNSGFMIAQYSAAAMVSENKVLSHPASVDSIPSSANQEDHVSMGNHAARKARSVVDNAQKVVGIELMAAAQGLELRGLEKASPQAKRLVAKIRERVPFLCRDAVMYKYLDELDAMVKRYEINALLGGDDEQQ